MTRSIVRYGFTGLFLSGMALELAMQTIGKLWFGPYWSPLVWLLAGLTVAGAAFWLFARQDAPGAERQKQPGMPALRAGLVGVVYLAGCWFTLFQVWPVFDEFPIEARQSDVIPSLEIYVRRLLSGETVYQPLHFPTWTVQPTYFPMMWLPYIIPELLKIDYRWLALGAFYGMVAVYLGRLLWLGRPLPEILAKAVYPFLALYLLIRYDRFIFGHSVELTPVAYYLFLGLTLFHRRPWVVALGIIPALLSRYAFTFWLPAYMAMIWIARGFKPAFFSGLYVLLGVALIYILPFFMKDPGILTRGLEYYEATAIGQWQTQSWQSPGSKPHHLNQGLSFGLVFYDFWEGPVEERLAANRKVQLWVCLLAAVLLLVGFYFWNRNGHSPYLYGLASLKAYLTLFYGFIHVPFSYLFLVPLFLSLPLLYEARLFTRTDPGPAL